MLELGQKSWAWTGFTIQHCYIGVLFRFRVTVHELISHTSREGKAVWATGRGGLGVGVKSLANTSLWSVCVVSFTGT